MTPLERGARAALDEFGIHLEELAPGAEDDIAQRVVRAVLEAIREPSEAMNEAAGNRDTIGYDPPPSIVWQAMIDAALSEKPE